MNISRIRNIGIIAHIDAGKTTTTERFLFYSGRIHRAGNVDEGTTTTDWYDEERRRGITIFSAAVAFEWLGCTIHLIDTPGHVDFTAEVERSLRVLDGAIGVFCGVGGVEAQSETVWRQADRYRVPRLAYVNKLDRVASSFERVVEELRERLAAPAVPVTLPVGREADFCGVIDLVEMRMLLFDAEADGAAVRPEPIPTELLSTAREARERLLDAACHHDDELLARLLDGEEPPAALVRRALRAGTCRRALVPVFAGSSLRGRGVQPLMEGVVHYLPSPLDLPPVEGVHPQTGQPIRRPADPSADLCALVFKTATDEYGELHYVRIYSGTLRSGQAVHNPRADRQERVQRLWRLFANQRQPIDSASAGEIVGVGGLKFAATGDTLGDRRAPMLLEPPRFPETVISMRIEPRISADRDKLLDVVRRLMRDDPTFRAREDSETGQIVISGMGELHLEILQHRITHDFHVPANVGEPRVAYRETVTCTAHAEERAILRAGDRTSSGHIAVEVRPQRQATKPVVVVALPPELEAALRRFLPAVREGLLGAAETGPLAGYPMMYVEVAVVGGSVAEDAAEAASTVAASRALARAVAAARPWILEPHMRLEVTVPQEYLGDILADLQRRRADIVDVATHGTTKVVRGTVPLARVMGYSTAIRSLTQGRGIYTLEPFEYRPIPEDELQAQFGSLV